MTDLSDKDVAHLTHIVVVTTRDGQQTVKSFPPASFAAHQREAYQYALSMTDTANVNLIEVCVRIRNLSR